ncbi:MULTISPECIES: glycosyltransferase family 4 protein [unclassified Micromonospora]|uniref:glycosyltransferase family 4 protein n=1 Tax=unclassified Micromonospora TaxID=2617518 RepID=UPI00363B990B
MRVLMISSDYPPRPRSGIGVHAAALARALRRLGVSVTVITAGSKPEGVRDGDDHYCGTPGSEILSFPGEASATLSMLHRNVGMAAAAGKLPASFDLVHCHDSRAVLAARAVADLWDLPLVMTKHYDRSAGGTHLDEDSSDRVMLDYEQRLERWGLERSTVIIAVSQSLARGVRTSVGRVVENLVVIPNGTEFHEPARDGSTSSLGGPRAQQVELLQVGRLVHQKGCDLSIAALSLLRDLPVHLMVAGDGPARPHLEGLARSLGVRDRVTFLGYVARSRLETLYADAQIALVPSRFDPCPIAVCEAQAVGKVVIGARIGGIPEQIDHLETGILTPPEDHIALAGWIRWVLADPDRARTLGERAGSHARTAYSWDRIAEATLQQYQVARGTFAAAGEPRRRPVADLGAVTAVDAVRPTDTGGDR